jgi:hypothetical protein
MRLPPEVIADRDDWTRQKPLLVGLPGDIPVARQASNYSLIISM